MGSLRKKRTLLEANQRIGVVAAVEFCYCIVCMYVRCRCSSYSYSNCMHRKKKSEQERKKERKKNDKRVHIHIAIQYIGQPRPVADIHAYREHHLVKR